MLVTAAAKAAFATRRRAESQGATFWHTTFIGANRYRPEAAPRPEPDAIYPMAFLVEQDANATVGAHFHQSDQFQVVVGGSGRLGTHEVAPVAVHFSGAFAAYGPIRAGAEGLHYFTLRNGWDPGARYMPGARAELPRPRRHREAVAGPLGEESGFEAVLGPESDGLAAWRWRLPAGARRDGPDPAAGRGQFWLVLNGTLTRAGESFDRHSCVFVGPDEPSLAAEAGGGGLDVLVMQFPRR
ncbi:MAG TPA: hypothetical protein VJ779_10765 [Acetobacteraceae bacterium]|nr:hypothetical protein [Acetobacteraceae bacterium]